MPLFGIQELLGIIDQPMRQKLAASQMANASPGPQVSWRPSEGAISQQGAQQQFANQMSLANLTEQKEQHKQTMEMSLKQLLKGEYEFAQESARKEKEHNDAMAAAAAQLDLSKKQLESLEANRQAGVATDQARIQATAAKETVARQRETQKDQFDIQKFISDLAWKEKGFEAEQEYRAAQLGAKDTDDLRQWKQTELSAVGQIQNYMNPMNIPTTPEGKQAYDMGLKAAVEALQYARAMQEQLVRKNIPPAPSNLTTNDLQKFASKIVVMPSVQTVNDAKAEIDKLNLSDEQKREVGSLIIGTDWYKQQFKKETRQQPR